jgi:hypothetical protein
MSAERENLKEAIPAILHCVEPTLAGEGQGLNPASNSRSAVSLVSYTERPIRFISRTLHQALGAGLSSVSSLLHRPLENSENMMVIVDTPCSSINGRTTRCV